MALDGITLFLAVNELKDKIKDAKIDKIFQPRWDEVHFFLRISDEANRLIISTNANDFRINLSRFQAKYPKTPYSFCMYLRKHLIGATILDIEQSGLERIVTFKILARDELYEYRNLNLIVELMGKYSNLIITDENLKVLSCLKHVTFDTSRVRQMLPGLTYELPPQQKADPFLMSKGDFLDIITSRGVKSLSKHISLNLQGISPASAEALLSSSIGINFYESNINKEQEEKLADDLVSFFKKLKKGGVKTYICTSPVDSLKTFTSLPTGQDMANQFDSANEMLDTFFHDKELKKAISVKKQYIKKHLKKSIEKTQKLLGIHSQTYEDSKNALTYKEYADLITANIFRIERGMPSVTVQNYYDDMKDVKIPLNVTMTPQKNVQQYYKKYNKLKTAGTLSKKHMDEAASELDFLLDVDTSVDNVDTLDELEEILSDLIKEGFIPEKKAQEKGRKNAKPKEQVSAPASFLSSDGFKIYAGRNNRQNDYVTLRLSTPSDIWLHAKGPGAHVLIKSGNKEVPNNTILEAAVIAAALSRQKNSDKASVDYTAKKNVWKASGARPGMVLYQSYKTINVKPDFSLLERLRIKK
ncbi:MAG: NFACT RNA binding domain-containing protein [Eubacteriales bacterium]